MADATPEDELAKWAQALDASGDYRVLRRLRPPIPVRRALEAGERLAIAIDTETTGLDVRNDEVIELGMLAFSYTADGRVGDVIDMFDGLSEPTAPLSPEITAITGLTPDDLQGQKIDLDQMEGIVGKVSLIIAHNAAFDRPFCERLSPVFAQKAWACSATEVAWREQGFDGVKLAYLLNECGFFHDAHRALDDASALLQVLSHPLANSTTPLQVLLKSARETTIRIQLPAPFELRGMLRKRGYRWRSDDDPRKRHWFLEAPEPKAADELSFLRTVKEIDHAKIQTTRLTAFNRYK